MTQPSGGAFVTGLTDSQMLVLEQLADDYMIELLTQIADRYADKMLAEAGLPYDAESLTAAGFGDIAGVPEATNKAIAETLIPLVAETYGSSWSKMRTELIEQANITLPAVRNLESVAYLQQLTNSFESVGQQLWRDMRDQMTAGFEAGESIPQIADRIRSTAGTSSRSATLIARSSIVAAANHGSYDTAVASGLDMLKEWMATPDARTRPTHREADGQRVPINGHFTVGGHHAEYPGDINLPPEERYRCRCTLGYVDIQEAPRTRPEDEGTLARLEAPHPHVEPEPGAPKHGAVSSPANYGWPDSGDPAHKITVTDLRALAKDAGFDIPRNVDKPTLIAEMRFWEAKTGTTVLPKYGLHDPYRPLPEPDPGRVLKNQQRPTSDTGPGGIEIADWFGDGSYMIKRGRYFRIKGTDYVMEFPDRPLTPREESAIMQILDDLQELHAAIPAASQYNKRYVWYLGRNPSDAYWAKQYNMPNFESAATAGHGTVSIWGRRAYGGRDARGITGGVLRHETGHNVDYLYARKQGLGSDSTEWADAIAADASVPLPKDWTDWTGEHIKPPEDLTSAVPFGATEYGQKSLLEDFAESYQFYTQSLNQPIGSGTWNGRPGAAIYFRDLFPNRAAVFDRLFQQYGQAQKVAMKLAPPSPARLAPKPEIAGQHSLWAGPQDPASSFTLPQLKTVAKDAGLQVPPRTMKPALIRAIREFEESQGRQLLPPLPTPSELENAAKRAAARARQAAIDKADGVNGVLSDLDEYAGKGLTGSEATERLGQALAAKQITKAEHDALLRAFATADPKKIDAAIGRVGKKYGLEFEHASGEQFVMPLLGGDRIRSVNGQIIQPGELVTTARRGATFRHGDELIRLEPTIVRPVTADEILAKRAAAAKVAGNYAKAIGQIRREAAAAAAKGEALSGARVGTIVDRANLPLPIRRQLVEAAQGGADQLQKSTAAILRAQKIKAQGTPGRAVKFDPEMMEGPPEIIPGARVTVKETGYVADIDGVPTVVQKTVVQPTGPTAARATKKAAKLEPISRAATGDQALQAAPVRLESGLQRKVAGLDDLPPADRRRIAEAIDDYATNQYRDVAAYLRGGDEGLEAFRESRRAKGFDDFVKDTADVKRTITGVDEALARSPLADDVVVWRGVRTGEGILGDPKKWPADLTGRTFTDPGFVSTSTDRVIGEAFARDGVLMRIKVPKGTDALALSDARVESELLLPRGYTFRVTRDYGPMTQTSEQVRGIVGKPIGRVLDVEIVPEEAVPSLTDWEVRRAELAKLVESATPQDIADARPLGGAVGGTKLVTTRSGARYVQKNYASSWRDAAETKAMVDAEDLGAAVMDAVGIDAPAVRTVGARVDMQYIDKPTLAESMESDGWGQREPQALLDGDDGRMMGVGDYLIANTDRNMGNVMLRGGGRLGAIDHGYAFQYDPRTIGSGTLVQGGNVWSRFLSDGGALARKIDVNPADLALIRTRLEALKPAFESRGRLAWHKTLMKRLAALEKKADPAARIRIAADPRFGELSPLTKIVLRQRHRLDMSDVLPDSERDTVLGIARELKIDVPADIASGSYTKLRSFVLRQVENIPGRPIRQTIISPFTKAQRAEAVKAIAERVQRAPSIRSFIGRDTAAQNAAVDQAFRDVLDGEYPGGIRVEVHAHMGSDGQTISFNGALYDAEGDTIGYFDRFIHLEDGQWSVFHHKWFMDDEAQGTGLGNLINDAMFDWYRKSGIDYVSTGASNIGSYTWAAQGFDFADRAALDEFLDAEHYGDLPEGARLGDIPTHNDPERKRQQKLLDALLARARSGEWISAREFSQVGRKAGQGVDDWWIGKEFMLKMGGFSGKLTL